MDEWFDLTCQVTVGLLPKYLDDDLPEAQVVRLEQHIVICPGCHTRLTQLRRTIAAVTGLRGVELEEPVGEGMAHRLGVAADDDAPDPELADRVVAYKFLTGAGMAPFSQVRWPQPGGGWVRASAQPGACRHAVHACRARDLAYWLDESLWRVELAGGVTESASKIVAESGRLLTVVDGWPDASGAFIADCAARLTDLLGGAADDRNWRAVRMLKVYAKEIEADTDPASVSYSVAHAAGIVGWLPGEGLAARGRGERTPFDAERRRQSRWLAQRLGLTG